MSAMAKHRYKYRIQARFECHTILIKKFECHTTPIDILYLKQRDVT